MCSCPSFTAVHVALLSPCAISLAFLLYVHSRDIPVHCKTEHYRVTGPLSVTPLYSLHSTTLNPARQARHRPSFRSQPPPSWQQPQHATAELLLLATLNAICNVLLCCATPTVSSLSVLFTLAGGLLLWQSLNSWQSNCTRSPFSPF